MKILDILSSPWAIMPSKLLELQGVYAAHLRGDKADIKGIEAAIGRPLANQQQGYEVINGVAVLPMNGIIAKRMNLMMQISGGVSTELVARDFKAALADPAVDSIILQIDSPGGTVDGTETLANMVRDARAIKPVSAFADGMMASAAYWIGSSADKIYISDNSAQIGSIGVVATHTDISGAQAIAGIKTTEITAGKYKRIASQFEALTESGKQSIQDQVDYLYSNFVQAVAQNRGADVETVLNNMADGRIFIGQQAVDAGLVDGMMSLDALVEKMKKKMPGMMPGGIKTQAVAIPAILKSKGDIDMSNITMENIMAEAPDVAEALRAEGRIEGAASERARIQAVENQLIPGHEMLIDALKYDGKTTGPEAAVAVLDAEKTLRGRALSDRRADAPVVVPFAAAPKEDFEPAPDMTKPIEERAKAKWDSDAKIRTEFMGFDNYLAFAKAEESGKVRVLSTNK